WVPAPSTPVCSLIPAFRNKIAWNRSARFRVFPFSWPPTLPLLSAPWHGAAVHTPLRSPTAGAVTPPASVPPRPPLASSHSFLRARRAAAHTVVSPCRVRTAPRYTARSPPTAGAPSYLQLC